MDVYFPTALAVASNNTDTYVGKYWSGYFPEETTLGQYRLTKVTDATQFHVVNDFAGYATFTNFGGPVTVTYDNSLRSRVVGTAGFDPTITVAAENSYVVYVYSHDTTTGEAIISYKSVYGGGWGTSTTFYAGVNADYNTSMLNHTDGAGPRLLLLTTSAARYSNPYPSSGATWTLATTFDDGYAKYGFASKTGVTTAVGADGRVRYTLDGITWSGTVITGYVGTTLTGAAWSSDGNACIAAGTGGTLAISTDGQTFTSSTALQSSAWGTRRAAAVASDPSSPCLIYVICGDGAIARTTDYGVTWVVNTGQFTLNQRYDSYSVEQTPIEAWVSAGFLIISAYGGQVFSYNGGSATDVSNDVNSYYTQFGTPDITGLYVDVNTSPTATIRGMFAGGFGRVMYLTTGSPFGLSVDTSLVSALVSGGYQTADAKCAYYDSVNDIAFVGLTSGKLAYRVNPLSGFSPWQVNALSGVVGDIIGISRLPSGDYLAVADYQSCAVGYYSGGSISWSVNSSLSGYTSFSYAKQLATNGSETRVFNTQSVLNTTTGTSWTISTLPYSPVSGNNYQGSLTYDPRMTVSPGMTSGYITFYQNVFESLVATSTGTSSPWNGAVLGYVTSVEPPVGAFSFGTTPVTIAIQPDGTGLLSTTPSGYGAWGSVPGVSNTSPSYTPPSIPNFYYPSAPVLKSAGVRMAVDLGIATGSHGRIWVSYSL